ncbi:MAG: hypothetical protein AMXMBFR64_52350 [Myxococcales bacterium]
MSQAMTSYRIYPPDRPYLERRLHTAFDGIPYFDEALQVPQSTAHELMIGETTTILRAIAREAGLIFLSDHPIWYIHPETMEQRAYYGDCVFARPVDRNRITSEDLLLVIEIVSTNDPRKETKDIHFQRYLNEFSQVPEFALVFPDLDDARSLVWCELSGERYEHHDLAPGGSVQSRSVPGLELRVLPRDQWENGHKLDIWYQGEQRPRLAVERARGLEQKSRAEQEAARAEHEAARAEQEAARAEHEAARAEHEAARAAQEAARADRLAARLRELGLDPEA